LQQDVATTQGDIEFLMRDLQRKKRFIELHTQPSALTCGQAVAVLPQQVEGVLAGRCPAVSTAEVTSKEVSHLQQHTVDGHVTPLFLFQAVDEQMIDCATRVLSQTKAAQKTHTAELSGALHTNMPEQQQQQQQQQQRRTFLLPLLLNSPCSTAFFPSAAYISAGSWASLLAANCALASASAVDRSAAGSVSQKPTPRARSLGQLSTAVHEQQRASRW
jgi:hypothetical protein